VQLQEVFEFHRKPVSEKQFSAIIQWEQEGYLRPMQVPKGTAMNSALLENVFVTLVCILNKIPVFIVGKPGRPCLFVSFFFFVSLLHAYFP
jgi:hypothetical protein